jgi:hypothetical protein
VEQAMPMLIELMKDNSVVVKVNYPASTLPKVKYPASTLPKVKYLASTLPVLLKESSVLDSDPTFTLLISVSNPSDL